MKSSYLNDGFFSRLETLALELKADLRGFFGGKHLVRTYGQTVEFADYREYMLGDDIRRIDWNLYSRFEKYFLNLFTDERQMHTQIFIDCSASMGKVNRDKAGYVTAVAAALGYLSVHNMDKVSFKLVKGDRAEDPFGTIVGKRAFFNAVSNLEDVQYDGECDLRSAIINSPGAANSDGLTVIISDFFTDSDWKKAVDFLTFSKRQVLLIQVLTPDEIDPFYTGRVNLIDSESIDIQDTKNMRIKIDRSFQNAYSLAMKEIWDNLKTFSESRDAGFITVCTDQPIENVLFKELLKVGVIA